MNKKAFTVKVLIGILLLAFLLVLALLVIAAGPGGVIKWWKTIAPTYNQSGSLSDETQIISYNLGTNKIEYYDGLSWTIMPQELVWRDKKIIRNQIEKNLGEEYYYSLEKRDPVKLEIIDKANKLIKGHDGWKFGKVYNKKFTIIDFDRIVFQGDILIEVTVQGHEDTNGAVRDYLILSPENILYEDNNDESIVQRGDKLKYVDAPEKEIISKVSKWRDSIFKNPITIPFSSQDNSNDSITVCVKKIDTRLTVNLNNPQLSCR